MSLVARTGTYYADGQALDNAEVHLTAACMTALGLAYPVDSTPLRTDEEWRPDLAERQARGYGLRESLDPRASGVHQQVSAMSPSEQQRYERALSGDPSTNETLTLRDGSRFMFTTQGCLAQSRATIYGSPMRAALVYYLPQTTYIALDLKVRKDVRYLDALHRWSGCMARRGYGYLSPADAKQHLVAEYRAGTPGAHDHEIAVAVADVGCAAEANVPGIVESLLIENAERLPDVDKAGLNGVASARVAAAERARLVYPG